ncbi:gluconolaconase [Solirubrobacter soli]|uniref:gluconolaconase n=1 Tax=Solirubrobacter soli TaxID=363832 RepID=UPI0012FAC763|nr:gluconolaconase [Solirubrobacter soli]
MRVLLAAMALLAPAASAQARDRDYDLPQAGVYIEGIGVDEHAGVFYVSATNQSGTIYRGNLFARDRKLEVWQPPSASNDGRGIDVDRFGRVFVAGGPAGEVRVFDRRGTLLAELPTGAAGSYLNDVWIGPERSGDEPSGRGSGATYVTDSSLPVIWRVSQPHGKWRIDRFLDVSGTIAYTPPLTDFDLGGITITPNGRYLLTTQGTTGQLWRIDLWTRRISQVDLGGANVINADGIVLRGHTLYVVQNFSRQISKLQLGRRFEHGRVVKVMPTPADRTFTTAKPVGRTLLAVDSKFGFPATAAVAEDRIVAIDAF